MKKTIKIAAIFCLLGGCSGTQQQHQLTNSASNQDAGSWQVDYDAYVVDVQALDLRLTMPNSGERVVPLRTGEAAPYTGILFNPAAWAFVEVEYRSTVERCTIERRADLERLSTRALTDLRHLESSLTYQREASRIILESRDDEITSLRSIINTRTSSTWNDVMWFGIGGLSGIGVASLLYLILGHN